MGESISVEEQARNEERESLLEAIEDGGGLLIPYRKFLYPEYMDILLPDKNMYVSLLDALEYLDISPEVLPQIFQMEEGEDGKLDFSGHFTDDGMQNLANCIGTKITYAHQPTSECILDLSTVETYSPVKEVEE